MESPERACYNCRWYRDSDTGTEWPWCRRWRRRVNERDLCAKWEPRYHKVTESGAALALVSITLLVIGLAWMLAMASVRYDQVHMPSLAAPAAVMDDTTVVPLAQSYAVPGLGNVTAGTHATERHAQEAALARGWLQKSGHCEPCNDGRTRCVASGDGRFAIGVYQVIRGTLAELTAFVCDAAYVRRVFDDCAGNGDVPPEERGW